MRTTLIACFLALASLGTTPASATATDLAIKQSFERPSATPLVKVTTEETPAQLRRRRDRTFGVGWKRSTDRAWLLSGDEDGLHVLVADAEDAYSWRVVTTLRDRGFDTDRWIGNGCLTGSGKRLVVVYAPRQFSNDEVLSGRGGAVAVVDLDTGKVRRSTVRASLAYHNPGCGDGEAAILTQDATGNRSTRLVRLDGSTGKSAGVVDMKGQVTGAVPDGDRMLAVRGRQIIRISPNAEVRVIARAGGNPSRVGRTGEGISYLDTEGTETRAVHFADGKARTLATGGRSDLGLQRLRDGRTVITGVPRHVATSLPAGVSTWRISRSATLSSSGRAAVTQAQTPADRAKAAPMGGAGRSTGATAQTTGAVDAEETSITLAFRASNGAVTSAVDTLEARSTATAASVTAATGSATDPVEAERTCSVPRNDPRLQTYQPTPRQVEWAADQAVKNNLQTPRPSNWKQSGLASWTPQGLFPALPLSGGGTVPATILLGVLAQESNMWQASSRIVPGVTGNTLIGGYYGRPDTDEDPYSVDFADADCGYGISQVTDGMVLAAARRPTDAVSPYPYSTQLAVALDYQTNIAAGLRILADKWNQTRNAGLVINDGNPARLENWFYALWAYNSGFYPKGKDASGAWGVGWANNPANPKYDPTRPTFLDPTSGGGPRDATHPSSWPYPERVLGFAAQSLSKDDYQWVDVDGTVKYVPAGAGFRVGWWPGENTAYANANRATSKPPSYAFCDTTNDCIKSSPDVCQHRDTLGSLDYKCWYHQPVTWKADCDSTCGRDFIRFDTTYKEPGDGKAHDPNCSTTGLPSGARVVDDVAPTVSPVHRPCSISWSSSGSFSLNFARANDGTYRSKVDFHQVGAGFGSHFYMTHMQNLLATPDRKVTGTWTFNQSYTGWGRVLVHLPDHGAESQSATYTVSGLAGGVTKARRIGQAVRRNGWADLGVFQFAAKPVIRLTNAWQAGSNAFAIDRDSLAYDAIAMVPLPSRPKNFVVVMGDSYTSGEGANDYLPGTDQDGKQDGADLNHDGTVDQADRAKITRNACHRSRNSWARKTAVDDKPTLPMGRRQDTWDSDLDFHLLACSGARTYNVLPYGGPKANGRDNEGQYGETTQMDMGFLDENTTLVALSIGGNDARFGDVVARCVVNTGACSEDTMPGDSQPLGVAEPARIRGPVVTAVTATVKEILRRAPKAKVVLMGYPAVVEPETLDALSLVPPRVCTDSLTSYALNREEATWVVDMTSLMNDQMGTTIGWLSQSLGRDVRFADPQRIFKGKSVCGDPAAINGPVKTRTEGDPVPSISSPLSAESFHPNEKGTDLYSEAFRQTLTFGFTLP